MDRIRQIMVSAMFFIILFACDNGHSAPQTAKGQGSSSPAQSLPKGGKHAVITWEQDFVSAEGGGALSKNLLVRNYYIVLDGSGSMRQRGCSGDLSKSDASKQALAAFSASVPPDANLGFAAFDKRGVTERLPLGTQNRDQFIRQVNDTQANSDTPLSDAILLGFEKLKEQAGKQLGYGEYHLVIVTDGIASAGQDPTVVVNGIIDKTPVVIHTIGFCIGENHALNQPGRTQYRTASNPGELVQGLKAVLAEAQDFDVRDFRK